MIEAAVVDASVAVKWVVRESGSDQARSLSSARLDAPDLLLIECANILWKKVRIGDLTRREASSCLTLLLSGPLILTDSVGLLASALELSCELQHPVYDCVYLALAIQRDVPLLTADRRLVSAARRRRKLAARVMLLGDLAE